MTDSRRKFLRQVSALVAGGIAAGVFLEGCASGGPTVYRYAATGNVIDLFLSWYPELYKTGGAVELQLTGTDASIYVVRVAYRQVHGRLAGLSAPGMQGGPEREHLPVPLPRFTLYPGRRAGPGAVGEAARVVPDGIPGIVAEDFSELGGQVARAAAPYRLPGSSPLRSDFSYSDLYRLTPARSASAISRWPDSLLRKRSSFRFDR